MENFKIVFVPHSIHQDMQFKWIKYFNLKIKPGKGLPTSISWQLFASILGCFLLIFSFLFPSHAGISLGFSYLNTIYLLKISVFVGQVMSNGVAIFISFSISRIRLECIKEKEG